MHTFTDNQGRAWSLVVNVNSIKRVRTLVAGFDLLKLLDEREQFRRLLTDPILLIDVLYALAKPDADAKGVSDEAFGAALVGDAIQNATSALLDALVDFFPQARRELLQSALTQHRALETRARKLVAGKVTEQMKKAERELETKLDQMLNKMAGNLSTDSPA